MEEYKNLLQKIFATDSWNGDKKLEAFMMTQLQQVVHSYGKRFKREFGIKNHINSGFQSEISLKQRRK